VHDSEPLNLVRRLIEDGGVPPETVRESLRLLDELAAGHDGPLPDLGELLVDQGYLAPEKLPQGPGSSRAFGKYLRLSLLGTGACGEVWKAYDWRLRRWVALKLLKHREPEEIARFRREAQAAAGLDHPSIATVYESGEIDGVPYIAMRLVRGTELLSVPRDDHRLLVRLVRDAARALHFAHERGVVHRDIKPSNILVEEGRVVVTDFGLAKRMDLASSLTASGNLMGTPAYMPPEQAAGLLSKVGPRSDVYSLGATLFELVTGRPPFQAGDLYKLLAKVMDGHPLSPRLLNPKIDPDLDTILLRCLEKEPRQRYPTADRLAEDLTRWLDGEPILARPPTALRVWVRGCFRRRRIFGAAALFVVLATAATIAVPRWRKERALRKERERELLEARRREEGAARARERALLHLEAARGNTQQLRLRLADPRISQEEMALVVRRVLDDFRNALRLCPDLPEAHLGMARVYILVRMDESAISELDRVIELSPDLATAYLDRARIRAETLEYLNHESSLPNTLVQELRRKIEFDLSRVRSLSREQTEILCAQAFLDFGEGRYARSLDLLKQYVTIHAGDARARELLGHSLYHLGRHADAEAEFDRALSVDAYGPTIYNHRAIVRHKQGNDVGAIEDFTESIRRRPQSAAPAFYGRGKSHFALKQFDRAIEDASEAIQRDPRHSKSFELRGVAKEEKGEWSGAIEDLTRAIDLARPEDNVHLTYHSRGRAYRKSGEVHRAIADYTRSVEIKPEYAEGWHSRGLAYLSLKRYSDAVTDFTRAVEKKPEWGEAY